MLEKHIREEEEEEEEEDEILLRLKARLSEEMNDELTALFNKEGFQFA